jgi:hypothetical protein
MPFDSTLQISNGFKTTSEVVLLDVKNIKSKHKNDMIAENNYLTIFEWIAELNRIEDNKKLKDYRLQLIKLFHKRLAELTENHIAEQAVVNKKFPLIRKIFSAVVYGCVLPMGLALHSVASFMGIQKLLLFIPAISSPVSFVISTILAMVNAAIFYSFEANTLKRSLGVEIKDRNKKNFQTDAAELETVKKINSLFRANADKLSPAIFEDCANAIVVLNQKVIQKKSFYESPVLPESKWSRGIRKVITGVNAVIMAGSSYFMATSLLTLIAAPLLGTPVGIVIVAFAIISSLVSFAAMRSKSTYHLLNPTSQLFQQNKMKFSEFEPITRNEIDKISRLNYRLPELQRENTKLKTVATLEKHIFNKHKKLDTPPKAYLRSISLFNISKIVTESALPETVHRPRAITV